MKKIIIWGASGHAMVVADALTLGREYEIVGFLDDYNPELPGRTFCGFPVFGRREVLLELRREGVEHLVFGFGNCEARLRLAEVARGYGYALGKAIHPSATVAADALVGAGTVVVAGAVINPGAVIGENVIVNTCASVDHECLIADGAHICPGVRLAGRVRVGRGTWVGIGSSVADGLTIGAGSMIGAGSVVVEDVPGGVLAYGVPARVMKRLTDES
ncbi:acetyltransferase [Citrifermentans bremense]|uniref:acetyltransferase n=1 Tax=Citrifermentans bremense TaxID=60035 RepID=UPI00040B56DC|nr:acetyltransferase [Citrifermentans bremense]